MAQLLSALMPDLLKKAGESLSTEFSFMYSIEQRREKLHSLLLAINQVITDAEEQAYKKPAVKSWIAQLKLAACDADDVLDELHYEALRSEALRSGHKINSGVRGFFSPHYNPLLFKYKIGKRLQEIVERFGDLVLHMNQFAFIKDWSMSMDERMQTHSYVDEQDVIGREGDRKKIVHMLLGAKSENMSVFSIVGIGVGKTTLAQLIFNDAEIKNGFQKQMWVCVSEEFSVPDIVKKVIVSAVGNHRGLKTNNMELLQQLLRKELSRKRCLLVLDDVWNKDAEKWDALRTLFGSCGVGSAVVVTTRDMEVASIVGTVETFHLEQLSPEDSWTLFSRRAFGTGLLESPELVQIGKKIVSRCHGIPVKSMGALMSTKQERRDWLNILESNTWNEENKILPALMVSYKHLPSYMKQCFAFCAVFPKDYETDKLDLIHLWISNGFIPSTMTSDLEETGNHIFSQLVWRSFFHDVETKWSWGKKNFGYRDVTTCKVHDLMHDLAVDISGNECLCLHKLSEINRIQQDVRHLASPHPHKIGFILQHCQIIRSVFSLYKHPTGSAQYLNDIINSTLRVLGLHIYGIKAFSFEPAFMKHLRYLDFSCCPIEAVPEVTSALYNLQVLVLNNCSRLNQLPEGMKYMVNLRHVYLDGCHNLNCMPADLGQLSLLRTLTKYVVENDPGRGIKELRNLKLGGRLHIYDLRKVNNALDAKEADLQTKHYIEELTFCWVASEYTDSELYVADDLQIDVSEEIFEALKPHHSLKVLNVKQYAGTQFPRWMTDNITLHNLVELILVGRVNCASVPSVCQLPCLEVLQLEQMNNLVFLCSSYSIDGEGCSNSPLLFHKLKFLSLKKMELLERWEETDVREVSSVTLPLLHEMEIIHCPKLTALPKVPVLKSLTVKGNKRIFTAHNTINIILVVLDIRRFR